MVREIAVRGRQVRYAEAGSGHPIVLLHAFPLSHVMWRHQLDAPPPGWRIVAPDLRGFGGSDLGTSGEAAVAPSSMNDYADDVVALMSELGLEHPVVGGVSMGGYVAFAVYRRLRARVAGLVLADTRAEADTDDARTNRRRAQALVLEKGVAAIADEMIPKLLGETTRRERPELEDHVRAMIEANTPAGIHAALECLATRLDSTPLLAEIACPTLIAVGREDQLTPVALHESMHGKIANARLEVIDGAGHLSNLERPAAFNAALNAFLDAVA